MHKPKGARQWETFPASPPPALFLLPLQRPAGGGDGGNAPPPSQGTFAFLRSTLAFTGNLTGGTRTGGNFSPVASPRLAIRTGPRKSVPCHSPKTLLLTVFGSGQNRERLFPLLVPVTLESATSPTWPSLTSRCCLVLSLSNHLSSR